MRLLAACFAAASAATWQYTQNEETPEGCSTHHACGPANWKLVDQSAACADKSTGNADQSNGRQYAGPGLVHADQHSPADSDMEVDSIQRSSEFGI